MDETSSAVSAAVNEFIARYVADCREGAEIASNPTARLRSPSQPGYRDTAIPARSGNEWRKNAWDAGHSVRAAQMSSSEALSLGIALARIHGTQGVGFQEVAICPFAMDGSLCARSV